MTVAETPTSTPPGFARKGELEAWLRQCIVGAVDKAAIRRQISLGWDRFPIRGQVTITQCAETEAGGHHYIVSVDSAPWGMVSVGASNK